MVLPLLLGLLGSGLASSGALAGLGTLGLGALATPLAAGAIGSGLGSYAETGSLEKGIMTGLGSLAGGALAGKLLGSTAAAGADKIAGGTAAAANPMATGAASLPLKANLATIGSGANAMNAATNPGMLQTAKSIMGSPQFMGSQVGSMIGGAMAPMKSSGDSKSKFKPTGGALREQYPIPRMYNAPPAGYRPGIDPEWNYGLSTPQSATDLNEYNLRRFVGGGAVSTLGPVRLAAGGIAAFAGDTAQEQAPNEKDIVANAIRAVKGQLDDPRPALGLFLQTYGEAALRDLVDKVHEGKAGAQTGGGKVEGPGDGMDDRVPAQIKDTGEDVLLADSEYVVPADVVSGLGNGSSDAGAKALDSMLERVRMERTGKATQPKQIAAEKHLPA